MRLYYNTNIGLFSNTKVLQFLGIRKHHGRWDTDAIQLQADHQPQNMGNQDGTGNEQEYRSIGNKPDAGQNPDEDNTHYQEIMDRDNFVTAEKVQNAFLGLSTDATR